MSRARATAPLLVGRRSRCCMAPRICHTMSEDIMLGGIETGGHASCSAGQGTETASWLSSAIFIGHRMVLSNSPISGGLQGSACSHVFVLGSSPGPGCEEVLLRNTEFNRESVPARNDG